MYAHGRYQSWLAEGITTPMPGVELTDHEGRAGEDVRVDGKELRRLARKVGAFVAKDGGCREVWTTSKTYATPGTPVSLATVHRLEPGVSGVARVTARPMQTQSIVQTGEFWTTNGAVSL